MNDDRGLDAERPDRTWENEETERRHQVDEQRRLAVEQTLRHHRGQLTLAERLNRALNQLAVASHVPAAELAYSSPSADHGLPAGAPDPLEAVHVEIRTVDYAIRQLERRVDEAHGVARPSGRMTTEEKDDIVFREFEGVPAEQVAQMAPYLGTSARTIERARHRAGERHGLRDKGLRIRLVDGRVIPILRKAA